MPTKATIALVLFAVLAATHSVEARDPPRKTASIGRPVDSNRYRRAVSYAPIDPTTTESDDATPSPTDDGSADDSEATPTPEPEPEQVRGARKANSVSSFGKSGSILRRSAFPTSVPEASFSTSFASESSSYFASESATPDRFAPPYRVRRDMSVVSFSTPTAAPSSTAAEEPEASASSSISAQDAHFAPAYRYRRDMPLSLTTPTASASSTSFVESEAVPSWSASALRRRQEVSMLSVSQPTAAPSSSIESASELPAPSSSASGAEPDRFAPAYRRDSISFALPSSSSTTQPSTSATATPAPSVARRAALGDSDEEGQFDISSGIADFLNNSEESETASPSATSAPSDSKDSEDESEDSGSEYGYTTSTTLSLLRRETGVAQFFQVPSSSATPTAAPSASSTASVAPVARRSHSDDFDVETDMAALFESTSAAASSSAAPSVARRAFNGKMQKVRRATETEVVASSTTVESVAASSTSGIAIPTMGRRGFKLDAANVKLERESKKHEGKNKGKGKGKGKNVLRTGKAGFPAW